MLLVFAQRWSEYVNLRVDLNMQILSLAFFRCQSQNFSTSFLWKVSPLRRCPWCTRPLMPRISVTSPWVPWKSAHSESAWGETDCPVWVEKLWLCNLPWFLRAITKHIILASGYCENMNSVIYFFLNQSSKKRKKSHAFKKVSFSKFVHKLPPSVWTGVTQMKTHWKASPQQTVSQVKC